MTALIPGLGGALVVAGVIGLILGMRPSPDTGTAPTRATVPLIGRLRTDRLRSMSARTRMTFLVGFGLGALTWLITGWFIAVIAGPAIVLGLPVLLAVPPSSSRIDRLEAMEEWTRSLSGVLTVGVGLEQALVATVRSTPTSIGPEVTRLVARLRARWATEDALRLFADELDDPTGDLVAANLILGARRRGAGLANVLDGLAESVAADVRARRQIEADRAKPRTTARWVTIITVGVLGVLGLNGTYIEPYASPAGQAILTILLGLYVATLWWMRSMATGKPLPRFLGTRASAGGRA